jgi:hypothetical protein
MARAIAGLARLDQGQRVCAIRGSFRATAASGNRRTDIEPNSRIFSNQTRANLFLRHLQPRRIKPGSLRRIKILAEMKDAQLAHLADFLELQQILQHTEVVRSRAIPATPCSSSWAANCGRER